LLSPCIPRRGGALSCCRTLLWRAGHRSCPMARLRRLGNQAGLWLFHPARPIFRSWPSSRPVAGREQKQRTFWQRALPDADPV